MANYKEETTSGDITSWVRAKSFSVKNDYLTAPTIEFEEEKKATLSDGTTIELPLAETALVDTFTNPDKIINLVNPITGESLGTTATYGDLQVIMHSLYLQLAAERDAAE